MSVSTWKLVPSLLLWFSGSNMSLFPNWPGTQAIPTRLKRLTPSLSHIAKNHATYIISTLIPVNWTYWTPKSTENSGIPTTSSFKYLSTQSLFSAKRHARPYSLINSSVAIQYSPISVMNVIVGFSPSLWPAYEEHRTPHNCGHGGVIAVYWQDLKFLNS